jgi:hypothetical protein
LTIVPDSTTMSCPADPAGIKVKHQHPARRRGRVINRDRARLIRRASRKPPGMPRRVGAAAVPRDPDVRCTRDAGRDRTPRGLCVSTQEGVRCREHYSRRVGRRQCRSSLSAC